MAQTITSSDPARVRPQIVYVLSYADRPAVEGIFTTLTAAMMVVVRERREGLSTIRAMEVRG